MVRPSALAGGCAFRELFLAELLSQHVSAPLARPQAVAATATSSMRANGNGAAHLNGKVPFIRPPAPPLAPPPSEAAAAAREAARRAKEAAVAAIAEARNAPEQLEDEDR